MIKLIGILVVALGFALRFNTLLVVMAAGVSTGLVAGMSFNEIMALFGTYFVENRYVTLTVLLISTEITFYWKVRTGADAAADVARLASLSIAWAAYGTALIIIGINRRYAPVRYLAIALLALTIGKVFLIDLSVAGGIYRIIGFIGLGLSLLLGAWLYQKYRGVILGEVK